MSAGRKMVMGILFAWGVFAITFVLTKPLQTGSHDFVGHVEQSLILIHEHRLARPYETTETQSPPLYYLLNSLVRLPVPAHINTIRAFSVLYGLLLIALIATSLSRVSRRPLIVGLPLLFIATTPKFIFLFTSYNNDSLATLLGAVFIYVFWLGLERPHNLLYLLLVMVGGLGLYTKLTFGFTLAAAGLVTLILASGKSVRLPALMGIGVAGAAMLLIILPWLALHNYRHTGHWIIHDVLRPEAHLYHSPLRTLFTLPTLAGGEWMDPYIHIQGSPKINSFVHYLFTSSVFGEAAFPLIPVALPLIFASLHALLILWASMTCTRSRLAKTSMATLVGGVAALGTFLFACPMHPAMDFRFIAWTWLPAAVLYATLLETTRERGGTPFLLAVCAFLITIASQILFLLQWLRLPGRGYI